MEFVVEEDEGYVLAQVVSCCILSNSQKIILHKQGNIPYIFDYWDGALK